MIGYETSLPRTGAQTDAQGAAEIWRLLQALDRLRAQRSETRRTIEMQWKTMGMQRAVIKELREENERLTLAAEIRDINPDMRGDNAES